MFQRKLERAERLHFTDNEEIVVKEGVDDGVSGAIESRRHVVRCAASEADVGQRGMMVRQSHSARHAVLDDTEIGKARVWLQNVFDRFESHLTHPTRSKGGQVVVGFMPPPRSPLPCRWTAARPLGLETVERHTAGIAVQGVSRLLELEQVLNIARDRVGRHDEGGVESVDILAGHRALGVATQRRDGHFREANVIGGPRPGGIAVGIGSEPEQKAQ